MENQKLKGFFMKKLILVSFLSATAFSSALSGAFAHSAPPRGCYYDGGFTYNDNNCGRAYDAYNVGTTGYCSNCAVRYNKCAGAYVQPRVASNESVIRVKTKTEVVNYYQEYIPTVVYQPGDTYAVRQVMNERPCNKCGYAY
jgi:hypothetical protein